MITSLKSQLDEVAKKISECEAKSVTLRSELESERSEVKQLLQRLNDLDESEIKSIRAREDAIEMRARDIEQNEQTKRVLQQRLKMVTEDFFEAQDSLGCLDDALAKLQARAMELRNELLAQKQQQQHQSEEPTDEYNLKLEKLQQLERQFEMMMLQREEIAGNL